MRQWNDVFVLLRMLLVVRYGFVLALTFLSGKPLGGQSLNQNCIVSVLNRNTPVNPDGSWVLPNVPAGFGEVRARATCVNKGITTFGQSDLFTITANHMNAIPPITLGPTSPIPTSLTITSPMTSLTTAGETVQLMITATYTNAASQDVTSHTTGTAFCRVAHFRQWRSETPAGEPSCGCIVHTRNLVRMEPLGLVASRPESCGNMVEMRGNRRRGDNSSRRVGTCF